MLLTLMLVGVSIAFGQTTTITGTVVDEENLPIPGATVIVLGAENKGSLTGADGTFRIADVAANATIRISYVGMATQEIPLNGRTTLQVILKPDSELLDEVVVVGYGVQKKENLTGSVASVDKKQLQSRPIQNLSSAIQGLMPGVTVTNASGRPGQDGGSIRIRGVGTLNTASPYILIDGVESGSLNSLDPNDIESISVLKDAASAAIYGSKASNGVILVTTKRGQTGKSRISYNGYGGIQNPTELVQRMSSYDYALATNRYNLANGKAPKFTAEDLQKFKDGSSPLTHPNTDWNKEAYRTGIQQAHNISLSGGTEHVRYMGSIGYLGQKGILPNSGREQFNGRLNLDAQVNERLDVRLNLSYTRNFYYDPTTSYYGGSSNQILRQLNVIAPWIVARYPDGTWGVGSDGSPIAWLDANQTVDRLNHVFTGIVGGDYHFTDWLTATANVSYVSNIQHYKNFEKFIQYNPDRHSDPNKLNERYYAWERTNLDLLLNAEKSFGNHNLKGLLGWHAEAYDYNYLMGERKNFPNNDLTDMDAGAAATQKNAGNSRELNMLSWFARLNYDYAGRYLFEANVRADASSRFAKGYQWGYFPSFSAAWRLSEEEFMEDTRDWLTNFKLRGSWGMLGNQDALSDYYPWMNTYDIGTSYPLGGSVKSGYVLNSYRLPTISWEKSTNWGVGLDVSLLGKVNLTVDYYNRRTTDIIMDVPAPDEFQLGGYKDNVGAMRNSGVEMLADYRDQWGDWSFNVSLNLAYNKNVLENLGGVDQMTNGGIRNQVGQAYNSFLGYRTEGIHQSDEAAAKWMAKYGTSLGKNFKAGDLIFSDTNNDGKVNADDRVLLGSQEPVWTYGITLGAGWKGIDFTTIWSGAAGVSRLINNEVAGYISGDMGHPSNMWLNAWTPENKSTNIPRLGMIDDPSMSKNISDFWVQDASYIRLKNLQLGYSLPQSFLRKLGVETMRVYYSAENLLTLHKMMVSIDPENTDQRGAQFPITSTHSIGINLTF